MRKILVTFVLVSSLVFSSTACVMANSVYLDGTVSGNWKFIDSDKYSKRDLSETTLGGDYSFGKFTVGLEYSSGKEKREGDSDWNYNKIYFKGGYDFLSSERVKLAVTLGYYVRDYDNKDNTQIHTFLPGLGGAYQINAKNNIQGSFDATIFTSITTFKYTYLLTDNLGVSIGFRDTSSSIKIFDDTNEQHTKTVGLTYKF